jgi:hypothetical protein
MDVINPAIARVQVWPVSLVGTGTLLDGGLNIEIIGELIERRRINLGPEPHPFRSNIEFKNFHLAAQRRTHTTKAKRSSPGVDNSLDIT